jgi:hypothetical protein
MRSVSPLALLALMLAGCDAHLTQVGGGTARAMNEPPDRSLLAGRRSSAPAPLRLADLPPEERHAVEADLRAGPDERERRAARQRAQAQLHPVHYALTPEPFGGDLVALVVRDPAAAVQRVIVLPESSPHDLGPWLGHAALRQDEIRVPEAAERRVLSVHADGHVVVRAGGREQVRQLNVPPADAVPRMFGTATDVLRWAAEAAREELIPEVGRVRAVSPERVAG